MKKLREYQQYLLDEILIEIPNYNRLCIQLSTGGGKTVIFTEMIKQLNSKTLILVDSIDLVHQTNETFKRQGIDVGMVLAGNKKFPDNKVIVAMVSTLWNRVKKNTTLLNDIQYCVIDECHVWIFNKLFDFLPNAKIIGFTATPVRLKRYKLDEDTTAMEVMADVYDKLICGKPINWLMENNYLVRDKNYLIDFDSSGLKTDSSGEFTVESMKKVFQHEDYKKALRNTYEIYCEDKKTMIFTASTETNAIFAELFKDKNVKTYDSVNNNTNERDSIIEWFKNTPDAILINTGCFTKGFDVCDVEAIIVARATKSLALWIQICGRGARITNKIKKDNIIIIDGGNNIEEHGTFSFNRNWNKIFSDRKIKLILEPQQECEACGFTFDEKDSECPNCGHIVPIIEVDFEIEKETKQFTINGQKAKLEPPTMDINFFINKGSTDYEALKILSEKWINFISKSKIEEKDFKYHWKKGTFQQRFDVLLKPQYLQIIRSILKKGKNVIYKNYCEKILTKAYEKNMEQIKFSLYNSVGSKEKVDILCSDYCEMIIKGKYQDLVLNARAVKKDETKYKALKQKMPCITGSAIMNQGEKNKANIQELNGLIVLDIDDDVNLELVNKINADQYTYISHRSFGGDGLCVFIKINPNKFLESFNELGQYYWDNFNLIIDQSCKNTNRLRFLSYDPYLFQNEKSKKFVAKTKIKKEVQKENFVFAKDDFTDIIDKVKDIDLCQDDYKRYCEIGFAIGSHFGTQGLDYFKAICQSGSKYDPKQIEKHYKNFCKQGGITISTFYYYVKEAGIEIYSEKTKATIKAVNVQKAQGKATLESVSNVLNIQKIEVDEKLINDLIESKIEYKIQEDLSNMAKLENFIIENYAPERNTITSEIKIDNIVIDDHKLNSIYKTACKVLDFNVSKSDVRDIINSDSTKDFNPLNTFFSNKEFKTEQIDAYINCIQPQSDYNRWAFKKWIVGTVHNWISPLSETKVSPLTFVLCGQKQGTGKTSFFRNLLPSELKDYLIEKKIDANDKDSMYNLAKGLICFDDEFGGLAIKDVKDFKRVADTNWIDIRLPYSAYYTKIKRRASICGTTNEANVLKDVTGNRRLLPVNVESIDYDKMISIDTDSLWREAFNLWRNEFDWKIYKSEDIDYLNEHTTTNLDVNPVEEIFFSHFSLEETTTHSEKTIMNQGDILNYLNIHSGINVSKYDVKDIFTKNKMIYKLFKVKNVVKKGILLYKEPTFVQNNNEVPF